MRRLAGGLLSRDPLKRIAALELLTEYLLWKLPRAEIERHLETPEPLNAAALSGARLYANREAMIGILPKRAAVAEVGVWRGDFSKVIAEQCEPAMLHLIDVDFSPFDQSGLNCPFARHEGDSSTILRGFKPGSLDWAYIDGDHSYEGARKDLEAAHVTIRPGGYLVCNDYTNWAVLSVGPYGVARAVNEFVNRQGYAVEGLAFSPWGNHDLLIRKPES